MEICISTLPPKHLLPPCVRAKSLQSCPPLCNPMDGNPPGSSVHGISQSRLPEWAAILFSRGSSRPRPQTWVTCTAGRFFTSEPPGKPPYLLTLLFFIFFPCSLALFFNFYFVLEYSWAQVAIVVKNSFANARHKRQEFDPWVRNIPCRGEHGNPLQNSCLKNPMGRGDWQAMVQGPQRVGHNWSNLARIVD